MELVLNDVKFQTLPPDTRTSLSSLSYWMYRSRRGSLLHQRTSSTNLYNVSCSKAPNWDYTCKTLTSDATGVGRIKTINFLLNYFEDAGCPTHGAVTAAADYLYHEAICRVGYTDGVKFPPVTEHASAVCSIRASNPNAGAGEFTEWQYNRTDATWYPVSGLANTGMKVS